MLFKKGAEANLYLETWYGKKIIRKYRYKKAYRIEELDFQLRRSRTFHEAKLLLEARKIGVPTPFIYMIDVKNTSIYMDYIEGNQLKKDMNHLINKNLICEKVGEKIGLLHSNDIIHGDLTTSNIIIAKNGIIYFIDFGLGGFSSSLEDKGVDLHLIKKALESTHYKFADECFDAILTGYKRIVGAEFLQNIKVKITEIESRGRYFQR
ncbi:MAG: KEOPS complex kinase/ATPase Bud32 [Candidatus Helarchaeota archaeon]